jgi:hypothetical protein
MAKQRLTPKQAAKKRQLELQAAAELNRLLKATGRDAASKAAAKLKPQAPSSGISTIPKLDYLALGHKDSSSNYPSADQVFGIKASVPRPKPIVVIPKDCIDTDLHMADAQEREVVAQVEIDKKKKRVAPMYNKGGYQYIGDDVDPKTIGARKI